jgi:hypothetical protein
VIQNPNPCTILSHKVTIEELAKSTLVSREGFCGPLDKRFEITNTVYMYSISDIVGKVPPPVTGLSVQGGDSPPKHAINPGAIL